MATLSGVHLMSFFAQIEPLLRMARANGCRTYLLAHSMGILALQSAVENWFLYGNGNAELFNVKAFLLLPTAASMRSHSLILLAWTVYHYSVHAFRFTIVVETKCWT
jgi:hypothetical protein